jgi:hypothetical protein
MSWGLEWARCGGGGWWAGAYCRLLCRCPTRQRLPRPEREEIGSRLAECSVVDVTCAWLGRTAGWRAVRAVVERPTPADRGQRRRACALRHRTALPVRLSLRIHADLLYSGPVTVDGRERVGWIFPEQDGSPWPVVVRMVLHRAGRRTIRRIASPGTHRPMGAGPDMAVTGVSAQYPPSVSAVGCAVRRAPDRERAHIRAPHPGAVGRGPGRRGAPSSGRQRCDGRERRVGWPR